MTMESKRNNYFVPGDGISREVITADICKYLDNDAVVKPGEYQGRKGFILFAYRNLTSAMIEDLKADSAKWENEKRQKMASQSQQRQWNKPQQPQQHQQQHYPVPDYTDSRTHHLRQQAAYGNERNSPSPSMSHEQKHPLPSNLQRPFVQQVPSPSQFSAQSSPAFNSETPSYTTHHNNTSQHSMPPAIGGFVAPAQSPASNYSTVQSPETNVFPNQSRSTSFPAPSFARDRDQDVEMSQPESSTATGFGISSPRNESRFGFDQSVPRTSAMPPPSIAPLHQQLPPQPPHTAPPNAQRDAAFNTPFNPQQSTDNRNANDARGQKRPFRENPPPETRRFQEQRSYNSNNPGRNRR